MAVIYLFRHGQTFFNRDKIFTGFIDSKLTPLGIEQAKALAEQLKDKTIEVAYESHLSRSKDTLKEVLKYHSECKKIIEDDRMIERSYGDLAGKTHDETIKKYGQEQFDKWHRGWSDRPSGGESFADVEVRVANFIEDLKKNYGGQDINIAISAHGNSIRLFRKIIEDKTSMEACEWTIPYDKIFEYEI
jgi:2,3-bisphosphoglycerate-dependent phosphoglycerate mutase